MAQTVVSTSGLPGVFAPVLRVPCGGSEPPARSPKIIDTNVFCKLEKSNNLEPDTILLIWFYLCCTSRTSLYAENFNFQMTTGVCLVRSTLNTAESNYLIVRIVQMVRPRALNNANSLARVSDSASSAAEVPK